jgi:hypothetical protein
MIAALREGDMHTVMKGSTFGRQQRESRRGLCHVDARLVSVRTCVSVERYQRRANCHSRKYRFRHDRTLLRRATPHKRCSA